MEMQDNLYIHEGEEIETEANDPPQRQIGVDFLCGDVGDFELAPLQNTVISADTCEVVIDVLNRIKYKGRDENTVINQLRDVTNKLTNIADGNNNIRWDPTPVHIMTPQQTMLVFQQSDVVEDRGGFVNFNATTYVWARTFLVLFPPIFREDKLVIMHDYTGYVDARG